jgi:hypothetical protein
MLVATTENRGGDRPTAGQNNPYKISFNGGNGQSGKKAQKAMQLRPSGGGASGATKALTDQISQGGFVKGTAPAVANVNAPRNRAVTLGRGTPTIPITADTMNREESIMSGTSLPGGFGPEALMLPPQPEGDVKFDSSIQSYAQPLEYIASLPNTSQETREVIALLLRNTAE